MESCFDHEPDEANELLLAYELEPDQNGLYWCLLGNHYFVVKKEFLFAALTLLVMYPEVAAA